MTLAGWALNFDWLKRLTYPGSSAMNPMTGVGFILAGMSLALVINEPALKTRRRWIAMLCGVVIGLIGAGKFASMRFGHPVDYVLFPAKAADNPMAPNTAGGFLCLGVALALLDRPTRRGRYVAVVFALLTASVAILALTGYADGVAWFYQVTGYIPMALEYGDRLSSFGNGHSRGATQA